jgi:CBS domain
VVSPAGNIRYVPGTGVHLTRNNLRVKNAAGLGWHAACMVFGDVWTMEAPPAAFLSATQTTPAPANDADHESVAALATTLVVKVPSWFTAGAALRVARLKGADHLLVLDRQKLIGSVSTAVLAVTPGHHPLQRCMTRCSARVTPDAPAAEAWRLMARLGVDCLPVVSGALLVGIFCKPATPASRFARAAE